MCNVGGARRLARQTAKKAVGGEIKGALGMRKVGFAALQDDADDGSMQRCQHLRPSTSPELAGVFVCHGAASQACRRSIARAAGADQSHVSRLTGHVLVCEGGCVRGCLMVHHQRLARRIAA